MNDLPHQCLKCGDCYPDGSPQILKGCNGCAGTRFFYTDRMLDDAEREAISDKAGDEIESMLTGAEQPVTRKGSRIVPKDGVPRSPMPTETPDWVRMTPGNLRDIVEDVVKRSTERRPNFRVGAPGPSAQDGPAPGQTLADWFRERGGDVDEATRLKHHRASVEARPDDVPDLIDEILGAEAAPDDGPDADDLIAATPEPVPVITPAPSRATAPRPVPAPVSLVGQELPRHGDAARTEEGDPRHTPQGTATPEELSSAPLGGETVSKGVEGIPPETIAIEDEGSYRLNIKRLLEKNPIVVHKDGTYSLHLPSLMEMAAPPAPRKRR